MSEIMRINGAEMKLHCTFMNWEVQGSTEIMFALFICAIIHTYLCHFLPLCCS